MHTLTIHQTDESPTGIATETNYEMHMRKDICIPQPIRRNHETDHETDDITKLHRNQWKFSLTKMPIHIPPQDDVEIITNDIPKHQRKCP